MSCSEGRSRCVHTLMESYMYLHSNVPKYLEVRCIQTIHMVREFASLQHRIFRRSKLPKSCASPWELAADHRIADNDMARPQVSHGDACRTAAARHQRDQVQRWKHRLHLGYLTSSALQTWFVNGLPIAPVNNHCSSAVVANVILVSDNTIGKHA